MIETFGANNQSIKEMLLAAANGRGVQAHGAPSESSLAAFLIGAGYRAYYGIGPGSISIHTGRHLYVIHTNGRRV